MMVDNFSQYGLESGGSAMLAGDKQNTFSGKKMALRELPYESKNIITKTPGTSPLPKDKGASFDSMNLLGTKRQQPDNPSSPLNYQVPDNSGINGHLVYVRRKLENEQGKISTSISEESMDPMEPRKISKTGREDQNAHQEQANDPNMPFLPLDVSSASTAASSGGLSHPHFLGKPVTGLAVSVPHESTFTSRNPLSADQQSPRNQDGKERFLRLQMFLKNCDQSSQEDYIRMLRSLSAVGRNEHAVELEKRAIHLLMEEGKELHRMKVLNVLGRASPKDHTLVSTQALSLQTQLQR
ncbi:uncharacterized protein [Typha angustifolia]|uniref:uncharacterized protein isoform X2 n=1 Tax=Typha angustifolia TaxID=59011 RepID=UPI003C2ED555